MAEFSANMGPSASRQMLNRAGGMTLPFGILAVVAMMVLPLPVLLLDVFFVFNILLALLVLMVSLHSYRPMDFSSFPSVLLIATVLRLALNVASTRIVLTDGHSGSGAAGKVIEAFGAFVIGGNFAVGLVVFVILMVINLMVITKGAGRVSEVSARFTLDAMPGKQMAIDADLNAGILTSEEARVRRADVATEADFYGAMDGASKFVKGDAVAGIIILAANIIGGIIIGTAQHGMGIADAAQNYVLLSIGDGLVAQIPSLLLSIATAIIVTRVSSTADMASHIGSQMNISRAWVPVAAVLGILGMVPGMPNMMFLTAAAAAGAAAWFAKKRDAQQAADAEQEQAVAERKDQVEADKPSATITAKDVTDYAPISIQIGYGLIPLIDGGDTSPLVASVTGVRRDASKAMGFVVPGVRIRDDLNLQSNQYRLRIGQAIVGEDSVYPDRKLALPGGMSKRKLKGIECTDPSFGMDAVWIMPHQQAEAEADDHVVVEPESVVATHLSQMIYAHADKLIGPDDVQTLLDILQRVAPTLIETVVPKLVPLHTLTSVLRHLLTERIPVGDLRRILEGLADISGMGMAPMEMAERLRPSLVPQMLQQIVPVNQPLPLITLSPELEQLLLRSIPQGGATLMVDNALAEKIVGGLSQISEQLAAEGRHPIVIVASALRRPLAAFTRMHALDCVVLGLDELPEGRRIEVVSTIGGHDAVPNMDQ
ncbi:Flagellar biosynthesis protein FlhA [Thalassovita gelatinovora]|uniref:Flagellar biosynthesis protein FlhA n=1 Tax=Thalassovita gelatinovora TaxID=53501 RepID=A0A0P1FEC4_THAGE|nr:flagellar biosynthesis protein FlhA [Thalassovita gelatinovora]CUH66542.1 Flagellar biosynthesis protein FlhA [Thalassovita gelatinovora]SEQ37631.1 flagellar biosynthesis protein FlhA [Thalassovita gelatinovora]